MSENIVDELIYAVDACDVIKISCIVKLNGVGFLEEFSTIGEKALCKASANGSDSIVELLLDLGADIESRCKLQQSTPLHWACNKNHSSTVELLLRRGAYVDALSKFCLTPLVWASFKCSLKIVKDLLRYGADIKAACTPQGSTVLHLACSYDLIENVMFFMELDVDLEAKNDAGRTALHSAARNGFDRCVTALLDKGAKIDATSADGETALHWASVNGKLSTVSLLLAHGADIFAGNKDGRTALHFSAEAGHVDIIRYLISAGADIDGCDKWGSPQYHPKPIVLESSHPYKNNTVENITIEVPSAIAYSVQFDDRCEIYEDHYVTFRKNHGSREIWGEERYTGGFHNAPKNYCGVDGSPPLRIPNSFFVVHFFSDHTFFCWGYKVTITPLFLSEEPGAKNGWTPLMVAAHSGQLAALRALLEGGADISYRGWCGNSAVSLALLNGHQESAILLAMAGAPLHMKCRDGSTPIMKAVKMDQHDFISAVLLNCNFFELGSVTVFKEGTPCVWHYILMHTDRYLSEVCQLLDLCDTKLASLANCTDFAGRTAIDIARPVYKRAMMERLYFYKRYDVKKGPPEHRSATCMVYLAKDHGDPDHTVDVALKFMINRDQFRREMDVRSQGAFDPSFVVTAIRYHCSDDDPSFKAETTKKRMYPYCIVMPAAERNIASILAHERIAGRDWEQLRGMCADITRALNHIHATGIIHGDVKNLNIVRAAGRLKFIDFDASVPTCGGHFVGAKYSSAFVSPEMLALVDGEVVVRTYTTDAVTGRPVLEGLPYDLVSADVSQDMWSLGAVLFHMFTGEPLFKANDEDNTDQENLLKLFSWGESGREDCMLKIRNPCAQNLVSRLLSRDPKCRPDTSRVLAHPYLTGRKAVRLVGDLASFDVFISYRVASDSDLADALYRLLTEAGLRVWYDKECLVTGKKWEEGFCEGLVDSLVFLPLISAEGMFNANVESQNISNLRALSPCDNVFLEHRLAIELADMGLIEAVCPVFVGVASDSGELSHRSYSRFDSFRTPLPEVTVLSVESRLREHLGRQGLGAPLSSNATVMSVAGKVFAHQGGFLEGNALTSLLRLVDVVVKTVSKLRAPTHTLDAKKGLDALLQENAKLKQEILDLQRCTSISRTDTLSAEDTIHLRNSLEPGKPNPCCVVS